MAPKTAQKSLSNPIDELRARLTDLAQEFGPVLESKRLVAGQDYLPPSGKVVGEKEFALLLSAAADMHLTSGRFTDDFEARFAKLSGMKHSCMVNSGSSANLLATATLTSPSLGQNALRPSDEVITVASGFPTTVSPSVQHGLKPVFVDVELDNQSPSLETIEKAFTSKTKLVILAHPLGNPFRADEVAKLCKSKGAWLIEDSCDALGARIGDKPVGVYGNLATFSFYPAHHITTGEGGAVVTNDSRLFRIAQSVRDWGRDCWCPPGVSNTCGKRFSWKMGDLPEGYDHKYIYSQLGYNLKSTDFQAALGLAQLDRLDTFVKARRQNHEYLTHYLEKNGLDEEFILPKATPGTEPSWFGYLLTLKKSGKRAKVVQFLEQNKVGTRLLFGGNLTLHPAFKHVDYRIVGELKNTDKLTHDAFWVGIWPGLSKEHMEYIAEQLSRAVKA